MNTPFPPPRHARFGGFALMMLLLLGCNSEPGRASIEGLVSLDGQPRSGIEVTFWNENDHQQMVFSTTTGDDGRFLVENIFLGSVRECVVTFSKPALKNGSDIPPDIKASEVATIDLAPKSLRDPDKSPVHASVPVSDFQYDIVTNQ
ncbi:carboxypeptidase-like regulatory domain-containing protein [Bremerella cremea]|uniref:carboxypeptidase-like regulatory domain-containing protein n=1 Tax=Bremerella cremea TaxID=1031537 RepID=UPI0031EF8BB7